MISLTSPVRTAAHDWSAGWKLTALCLASVMLFRSETIGQQLLWAGATLVLYALPGPVFLRGGLSRLLGLWPFVLMLALWHGLTGDTAAGAVIALRMITAVAMANLVTMTTPLSEMIALTTHLLGPLARFGLPVRAVALSFALVIRFVPVLADKGGALATAWRARSARRPGWRIILPFTLLALDDAEQVAEALRARGGI